MTKIKNVCVYSSASDFLSDIYYEDAAKLGTLMGKNGFDLVYGGGRLGLMYANAKAVKDAGGKVVGVLPKKLYDMGLSSDVCDEVIVTDEMRSRKEKMDVLSDACIALAGGFGTLEEISEMIVQKQLAYNAKAIVFLNTNGFYDNLMKFFDDIIKENFAQERMSKCVYFANTPEEAIDYLLNYVPEHFDVYEKLKIERPV
ncbi:MAG: TIGR00730 family Rossman fold protein [bacterium]|nr:TIGR00730 family Rossman fold protein [bacterium]